MKKKLIYIILIIIFICIGYFTFYKKSDKCQFDIKNKINLCEIDNSFYISKNHDLIVKNIKKNINYTFFDQNPDMQEICEKIVKGNFDTMYIKISENGNMAIDGCYINDQFIDIFLVKQFLKTKKVKIY